LLVLSQIKNKKGLSAMKVICLAMAIDLFMRTAVAAAASVPSSPTSTNA